MSSDLYIAASAQITLQQRMESLAQNIANINTAGYRAEGIKFESLLATAGSETVTYSSEGETFISRKGGPISHTGNALDVAVDGEGWLALLTPDGTVYTRDGRMQMTEFGELQSVNGYAVGDPGGAGIVVDPSAGPIAISEGGVVSQGGKQVGAIGLFLLPETAKLVHYGNSAVISDQPATPAEDPTVNSIRQGYLEGSNVNAILEITRLIEVSRAFESAAAALENSDDTTQQAIRTLSSS